MKKQTKQLIVLAAILAAVLIIYLGLRLWNKAQEDVPVEDTAETGLVGLDDLTQISFTANSGETIRFTNDGERWTSEEEPELALIQENLNDLEAAFCTLSAQRTLEEPDALDGYGLDPAARTVTGSDAEGNTVTILLGNEINYEDIYYAMVDGQGVVYTVSGDLFRAIRNDLMDLAVLDTMPEMSEVTVKSISLNTAMGELVLNKLTEKKQEIQVQETGETDENGEAVTEEVVVTEEIYHWSLADGTQIPDGNETLTAVLDELSALSFSAACTFQSTQEELTSFGLDDSAAVLRVEFVDGTAMELTIGDLDAEGESYYARLADSDLVHLLAASEVETLQTMSEGALTSEPSEETTE